MLKLRSLTLTLTLGFFASTASATTIVVPGTSDLWLAGAAIGTRASGQTLGAIGVDEAPQHSPVAVLLATGTTYELFSTGCVGNGPALPCAAPDGFYDQLHLAGAENGVDSAFLPLNSLIGLFGGSSTAFLVGSHFVFTAPSPLLYLGTMDGWEWNNNYGAFVIELNEVQPVPETSTFLLVGLGLVILRRIK